MEVVEVLFQNVQTWDGLEVGLAGLAAAENERENSRMPCCSGLKPLHGCGAGNRDEENEWKSLLGGVGFGLGGFKFE